MNTYAIQVELHFQSAESDDSRFEGFVDELKRLAAKHGISFGEYQSMQLKATDYSISPCASCAHLTVDRSDIEPGDENMLPDFWFYVRRGTPVSGLLTCDLCEPIASAT